MAQVAYFPAAALTRVYLSLLLIRLDAGHVFTPLCLSRSHDSIWRQ
jgi:hypothetical protein